MWCVDIFITVDLIQVNTDDSLAIICPLYLHNFNVISKLSSRATERRAFQPRPDHVVLSVEPIRAEDWKKINNTRGSSAAAGAWWIVFAGSKPGTLRQCNQLGSMKAEPCIPPL